MPWMINTMKKNFSDTFIEYSSIFIYLNLARIAFATWWIHLVVRSDIWNNCKFFLMFKFKKFSSHRESFKVRIANCVEAINTTVFPYIHTHTYSLRSTAPHTRAKWILGSSFLTAYFRRGSPSENWGLVEAGWLLLLSNRNIVIQYTNSFSCK